MDKTEVANSDSEEDSMETTFKQPSHWGKPVRKYHWYSLTWTWSPHAHWFYVWRNVFKFLSRDLGICQVYACREYGPKHDRPHIHMFLLTNKQLRRRDVDSYTRSSGKVVFKTVHKHDAATLTDILEYLTKDGPMLDLQPVPMGMVSRSVVHIHPESQILPWYFDGDDEAGFPENSRRSVQALVAELLETFHE